MVDCIATEGPNQGGGSHILNIIIYSLDYFDTCTCMRVWMGLTELKKSTKKINQKIRKYRFKKKLSIENIMDGQI